MKTKVTASEQNNSTAGLYFRNSEVNVSGTLESVANEGYIASIQSLGSNIIILNGGISSTSEW